MKKHVSNDIRFCFICIMTHFDIITSWPHYVIYKQRALKPQKGSSDRCFRFLLLTEKPNTTLATNWGLQQEPCSEWPLFYFMRSFRLFSFVIWTVSFIMLWTVGLSCQLCVRVIATWLADSSFRCVAVIYVLVVFIDCGADCQILQGFDQTTCL